MDFLIMELLLENILIYSLVAILCIGTVLIYVFKKRKESRIVDEKIRHAKFDLKHIPVKTLQASLQDAADPLRKSWFSLLLCYAHGERGEIPQSPIPFPAHLISVQDYSAAYSESQNNTINYPPFTGLYHNKIYPSLPTLAFK